MIQGGPLLSITAGPVLRADWLKELGLNEPETLDEWEVVLQAFKDKKGAKAPLSFNYGISNQFFAFLNATKSSYIKDGKMVFGAVQPEFKEALQIANDWFKKGYIRADVASATDDMQDFNAGKYAVWVEKYKPGILDEMKIKYGKEVVTRQISENILYSGAPDAMTGISATSKNPEKAMELLALVNTDKKLYNLICYGIEGKHYNLDENGRVVYVENSGYAPKACWKFGNQFNALLIPGQPEDVWEQTMKMNDEAIKSPLMGFTFDTDPVKNEISNVATIIKEYHVIAVGAEDPEKYYDEMIERLKGAGIDKIVTEVKNQYDKWQKNK